MEHEDGIKAQLKALGISTFVEDIREWEMIERDLRGAYGKEELQAEVASVMARRHAPKQSARKSKWNSASALNRIDDDEIGSSING